MAEVSNLHRFNHQPPPSTHQQREAEPPVEEFYHQRNPFFLDIESFSPSYNSANPYIPDDYTMSLDLWFDASENPGCEYEDPNCFYGGEEDDEQMNFVTDLFESARVTEDQIWDLRTGRVEDSPIELGFGPGLRGLRVAGTDSESDTEEVEVNSRFCDTSNVHVDMFGISNTNNFHISENEREDFEWEGVSERVHFDETENLNSVINRIEELSVSLSSEISSFESEIRRLGDDDEGEEEERNVEWEVLLAVNNLERAFELDSLEENNENGSQVPHDDLPEDYILAMEYDALFGQLVENDNALMGSPPAAKSVVENLPSVVLRKEEIGEDNSAVVCAVCKDEVEFGEMVTKMPCCHLYHGECILPWLSIRNTCPVCRYELPTDDADYEKRKNETGRSRISTFLDDDLETRGLFFNGKENFIDEEYKGSLTRITSL